MSSFTARTLNKQVVVVDPRAQPLAIAFGQSDPEPRATSTSTGSRSSSMRTRPVMAGVFRGLPIEAAGRDQVVGRHALEFERSSRSGAFRSSTSSASVCWKCSSRAVNSTRSFCLRFALRRVGGCRAARPTAAGATASPCGWRSTSASTAAASAPAGTSCRQVHVDGAVDCAIAWLHARPHHALESVGRLRHGVVHHRERRRQVVPRLPAIARTRAGARRSARASAGSASPQKCSINSSSVG